MGRTPPINRRIFKAPNAGGPYVPIPDVPASSEIRDRARARWLRTHATGAERILWFALRRVRNDGFHFRPQAPFDCYIVDFVCHRAKIIVELDGSQHATNVDYDMRRTAFLNARGYEILRFWNHEVMRDCSGVVDAILRAAAPTRSASPATQNDLLARGR